MTRMPCIHPWPSATSLAPVLQCLRDGGCVAVPTESTYEVIGSALRPESLQRLSALVAEGVFPALVLTSAAQLRNWMPFLRGIGPRLYRKLGPGPLLLRADGGHRYGAAARLPELARSLLIQQGFLAVRWPTHPVWTELAVFEEPLIALALPSAKTPAEIQERLHSEPGNQVDGIVAAGPTEFEKLPSVVRLQAGHFHIEREGALSAEQIGRLALCRILFICTGNTCRSPMAEALCSKLLGDQLGCRREELKQHGFCVQSAGLAAMIGQEASADAVTVVAQQGADLSAHRSRMVTMEMLAWSDHLFAMTASHCDALKNARGFSFPEPQLLSPAGEDVADPIGGVLADYQGCAQQIADYLHQRLPQLLES